MKVPHGLPRRIFCSDLICYPKLDQDVCFGSEIQFICKDECSLVLRKQNAGADIKCLACRSLSTLQNSIFWYMTDYSRWTQEGSKNSTFKSIYLIN